MIRRRNGVVTDRRPMTWHVFNHSKIWPKLQRVGVTAAGVYIELRCMAGNGHFDGSIWCGEIERMTTRECADWIARRLGGDDWRNHTGRAKDLISELRAAGLVVWGKDRRVFIVDFVAEQFTRPKTNAERVAEHRQRSQANQQPAEATDDSGAVGTGQRAAERHAQRDADTTHRDDDPSQARGPHAPPPAPLPPTLTPNPTESEGKRSRIGFHPTLQCNENKDQESETKSQKSKSEKDAKASSDSDSDPTGRGAGGGAEFSGDLYSGDPVETALRLIGDRSAYSRNVITKKLRDVGDDVFFSALGQFREARRQGIGPKTRADGRPGTLGGMLVGYINANAYGGRAP